MLTVIIKRNAEPTVIQMTQENVIKELRMINGSEMLLEDTWLQGLKKVRTPYVCMVEADCELSASFLQSNVGLLKRTTQSAKGGGYNKLAMIASSIGVDTFSNRIFGYRLGRIEVEGEGLINGKAWSMTSDRIIPDREQRSKTLYHTQIGFLPGAVIRYASISGISGIIDKVDWDNKNLVKTSAEVSFHFWQTNRRIKLNPNTVYVSTHEGLEAPSRFKFDVPYKVGNIFKSESI